MIIFIMYLYTRQKKKSFFFKKKVYSMFCFESKNFLMHKLIFCYYFKVTQSKMALYFSIQKELKTAFVEMSHFIEK
jgi:hypothetical protein